MKEVETPKKDKKRRATSVTRVTTLALVMSLSILTPIRAYAGPPSSQSVATSAKLLAKLKELARWRAWADDFFNGGEKTVIKNGKEYRIDGDELLDEFDKRIRKNLGPDVEKAIIKQSVKEQRALSEARKILQDAGLTDILEKASQNNALPGGKPPGAP
jgi:hypothetical protein